MSETAFQLDPRLQADSAHVAQLPLCELRLMNDARFPWLLLIPRQHGLSELDQLNEQQHHLLWQDIRNASAVLRATSPCDKLNIGALGNIVRQLHIHVVARVASDSAWPGPVWGSGPAQAYPPLLLQATITALRHAIGHLEKLRGARADHGWPAATSTP